MALVTRGHQEDILKWPFLSTRRLADELKKKGHPVSHTKVAELLKEGGFSLQSNSKRLEETEDQDRNEQFMYINATTEKIFEAGYAVISIDTKKKELIGTFRNFGKTYHSKGRPKEVQEHDFGDKSAAHYGVYDMRKISGFVNAGVPGDISEFAVNSIRQWWRCM